MTVLYLLLLLFGTSNSIKCFHTTHGTHVHEVICPTGTAGCMRFEMSKVHIFLESITQKYRFFLRCHFFTNVLTLAISFDCSSKFIWK